VAIDEKASAERVESFRWFCGECLIQSKDRWAGLPLTLEPFQIELMSEALALDETGKPVWSNVVILMPRKNGKTELLAAYALFSLLSTEGLPEILLAASSDKQAGMLFDAAALYCRNSPSIREEVRVRDHVGEIMRADGMGRIRRLSADPRRLHGYNPTLVVLDELAQWTTPELKRAHAALTSGQGARSAPQTFTISTAGEAKDREDSILGRVLDGALERGELEERPGRVVARHWAAKTLVYNHEAPTTDPHDVEAMKLANPAPWITIEFLRTQADADELSDAETLQLHGGVWAAGESSWLPAGVWRACQDVEIAENAKKRAENREIEVVLGFDGSYSRDSTALVACTIEDRPVLWVEGVWERPEGAKDGWRVPRGEVNAAVEAAMAKYEVRELACDPPGWIAEVEAWGEVYDTLTLMFSTNRTQLMHDACSQFYSAVVESALWHDGDDAMARHLANAIVKASPDGRFKYISKDHPDSRRKIDLAVAAVIAHARVRAYLGGSSEPMIAFV
jgi:phage terminase large subunit-like protein